MDKKSLAGIAAGLLSYHSGGTVTGQFPASAPRTASSASSERGAVTQGDLLDRMRAAMAGVSPMERTAVVLGASDTMDFSSIERRTLALQESAGPGRVDIIVSHHVPTKTVPLFPDKPRTKRRLRRMMGKYGRTTKEVPMALLIDRHHISKMLGLSNRGMRLG